MAEQVWGTCAYSALLSTGFSEHECAQDLWQWLSARLPLRPQCWGPRTRDSGRAGLGGGLDIGPQSSGWFPCAARVRTAVSPHTFKLANSVSQRHVMGSCLVFPQSFLFCSWPLPSLLLLCGPASVLSASWDTSRGSSTVLYLISSSEQPSRVDVITPFYRRGN